VVSSRAFVDQLTERGFGPFIGVPCSFLKPFINYVIEREDLSYLAATNEGEALALAVGMYLGGRRPVVMIQNSGLGNLVNPLTSLAYTFRTPLLLITTWRGQPGLSDEPQHEVMGAATPGLFDLLRIPHELFPSNDEEIEPALDRIDASMATEGLPFALILPKGRVMPYELREGGTGDSSHVQFVEPRTIPPFDRLPSRRELISAMVEDLDEEVLVVATTGKTGRELFEVADRRTHFYMVGSMGCAASVGLGICLTYRTGPVVVLDGDGAALMRLESMASIGHWSPENLVHVVLDNGTYDSTGGQRTIAASVSFPHLAAACGYRSASTLADPDAFRAELASALTGRGPYFIHARIQPGTPADVGRPTLSPPEVADRLRQTIERLRPSPFAQAPAP
jgi:phosphonopyruvate decarboxylase